MAGGEDAWSAEDAWQQYHEQGFDSGKLTISSDGGGCLPEFDAQGELLHMDFATSAALAQTLSVLRQRGYGYEQILKPDGYDHTFAEMFLGEKNLISHRGRAVEQLPQSYRTRSILLMLHSLPTRIAAIRGTNEHLRRWRRQGCHTCRQQLTMQQRG